MILSDDELSELMDRCDRAIVKLREERLCRANAVEMINATVALMSRLRQDRYARKLARQAFIDESVEDAIL